MSRLRYRYWLPLSVAALCSAQQPVGPPPPTMTPDPSAQQVELVDDPEIRAEMQLALHSHSPYHTYVDTMVEIVGSHWFPGATAIETYPVVKFLVDGDGRILNPSLEKSSGIFAIDHAAVKAVTDSSPLPRLPGGRRTTPLTVHLTFGASREASAARDARVKGLRQQGLRYLTGDGVQKNAFEAISAYRQAAGLHDGIAMISLANIYEGGHGVPRDMAEAISWYRRAAQEGNTNAQLALGRIYETGDSVTKDPVEAVSWYRKAARSNEPAIAQQARAGLERLAVPK